MVQYPEMPYVVAIVSSHGMELQRRAARTEPEWTFADLYSSLLISNEYEVLKDQQQCENRVGVCRTATMY